ncbi:MAG: biotin--[acetyl-CoA-carboxylase] ligase [Nocardioidaceae bacterium]|nr:biotin--[acetyl-CoA-carboxylase] ligase [Nocardioidaceae bacterium]MCL2614892.1 biotin--[acetyl-CoA-carboxylase] ligase [Nocardioidaceae bacterium]
MTAGPTPRPPFDAAALDEAVATYPDLNLELVDRASSSNEVAAERARAGAPDGLVVVVDHQTAGRGRLDRTWETPAGAAVTFSLLVRPTVPAGRWPWIPLLVGHNVAKSLTALGYSARVKWPNDILLTVGAPEAGAEKKVAGILVERIDTPAGRAAVIGVGINVGTTAEELPVDTATSLALASDVPTPERSDVLLGAVAAIREGFDVWQTGGEPAQERLRTSYLSHCATVGLQVRAQLPGGGALEGRASDVDPDGRLVIETADGPRPVGAGDVVHVRPADSVG